MTSEQQTFATFQTAGWADKGESYEGFLGLITRRGADALLDAAGVKAGTRVLDVATGPGYVAACAAARKADVLGVDRSPSMVELAHNRHPDV
jgi:ubiquinone/menaquinone biosynthesis C-methylase UbiE